MFTSSCAPPARSPSKRYPRLILTPLSQKASWTKADNSDPEISSSTEDVVAVPRRKHLPQHTPTSGRSPSVAHQTPSPLHSPVQPDRSQLPSVAEEDAAPTSRPSTQPRRPHKRLREELSEVNDEGDEGDDEDVMLKVSLTLLQSFYSCPCIKGKAHAFSEEVTLI